MIVNRREQQILGSNPQLSGHPLRHGRPDTIGGGDEFPGNQCDLRGSIVQDNGSDIDVVMDAFESRGAGSVASHGKRCVRSGRDVHTGGAGTQGSPHGPGGGATQRPQHHEAARESEK
jgi:hypothetical protein